MSVEVRPRRRDEQKNDSGSSQPDVERKCNVLRDIADYESECLPHVSILWWDVVGEMHTPTTASRAVASSSASFWPSKSYASRD
jgi:hypothetical protein